MAKAAEEVQRSGKPVSRFGVDPVSDEKELEAPFCPHGGYCCSRKYSVSEWRVLNIAIIIIIANILPIYLATCILPTTFEV